MKECELFLLIDEDGDYVIATDMDDLDSSNLANGATRLVRVILNVPLPTATVVTATIPAESGAAAIVAVA
jgi:hypothetical protein